MSASTLPPAPFVCVITDDVLADDEILAACESACAAAPVVIQLRVRDRSANRAFALATALREITHRHHRTLVVHERLDIALASGADGVHLPTRGLHVAAVRHALDERHGTRRRILGVSVHSIEAATDAAAHADYVQYGHLFATPAKTGREPRGLAALQDLLAAVAGRTQVVAVGGIDETNAASVVATGVAGVAVIRAVMRAPDPGAAARRLTAIVRTATPERKLQHPMAETT